MQDEFASFPILKRENFALFSPTQKNPRLLSLCALLFPRVMIEYNYKLSQKVNALTNNKKTAAILTLGCRVNQYESDYISERLTEKGYDFVPFGTPADLTIVNTCTVTAESDRKSRQMIRRAVSASGGGVVVVTGCYAETGLEDVRKIDGVTYVTGNAAKSKIPEIAETLAVGGAPVVDVVDIDSAPFDKMILKTPQRTRSYIKIEDGCDNKCSYCIISSARGNVRSKPLGDIVAEATCLKRAGCREVILTGIETSAYGRDLGRDSYYGESLAEAIEAVADLGFERIGLGSLEPTVMNERFVERISKVKALMPHFHLSVQSGSTTVLNRMCRRYNADRLSRAIERLKAAIPEVTLSADVIVGFPGETEAEFEETLAFAKKHEFMHLHIFPYSIRRGTKAAVMSGQLQKDVKNERLRILSGAQDEIKASLLDRYVACHRETTVSVLVEKVEEGIAFGHSEHFLEVLFPTEDEAVGKIAKVTLVERRGETLFGEAAEII